jgi:hypothetical protein
MSKYKWKLDYKKEGFDSYCQQFNQYQQNEQPSLTSYNGQYEINTHS